MELGVQQLPHCYGFGNLENDPRKLENCSHDLCIFNLNLDNPWSAVGGMREDGHWPSISRSYTGRGNYITIERLVNYNTLGMGSMPGRRLPILA